MQVRSYISEAQQKIWLQDSVSDICGGLIWVLLGAHFGKYAAV